mmetsp:Transcript_17237/g.51647  ORF Transcript_17237/g.51647 Transcript_17237/m.51647 type:complete len:134 (+) Transcript_17237:81-482(+)
MASGQGSTRVGLTPSRSNPSLRNTSGLTPMGPSGASGEAKYLMPACYKSHKALARTFDKMPGLFSGGGERMFAHSEKFPDQAMATGNRHMAYVRRQLYQSEAEIASKSHQDDPWPLGEPKAGGAPYEVIHKGK